MLIIKFSCLNSIIMISNEININEIRETKVLQNFCLFFFVLSVFVRLHVHFLNKTLLRFHDTLQVGFYVYMVIVIT